MIRFRPGLIALVILPLATTASVANSERIKDIVEAGIGECAKAPESIGPKFYKAVRKACKGKSSCRVRATILGSQAQLKAWGCSYFFVIAQCAGGNKEVRSKGLGDKLRVSCN
jgi:hypothetical protein